MATTLKEPTTEQQVLILRKQILNKHSELRNLIVVTTIDNRKHYGNVVLLDNNSCFIQNDKTSSMSEVALRNIIDIKLLSNGSKETFEQMKTRQHENEQPEVDVWLTGDENGRDTETK